MTLTELSYYVRRSIVPTIIGGILLIILYFVITGYLNYLKSQQPKVVAIEPIFGKINKLVIKNTYPYPREPRFTLDTIEGQPKTATASAKVYFLPPKTTRFGYIQKIFLMAKKLGFNVDEVKHKINDTKAVFEDNEKTAAIDITNYNFTYAYKYDDNQQVFDGASQPEDTVIKEKIKAFLSELGRYPEELTQGKENIIFLQYSSETKEFIPVVRRNQANAIEFDLYRPDIDIYPAVSPTYFGSPNYVTATFHNDEMTILKAQMSFFEKENEKVGVYPLKTGQEAWEELKNKQGFILSEGNNTAIVIKKMFLGYLDPDIYQSYLQPVYVFLSSDGFAAYVPAVEAEYSE